MSRPRFWRTHVNISLQLARFHVCCCHFEGIEKELGSSNERRENNDKTKFSSWGIGTKKVILHITVAVGNNNKFQFEFLSIIFVLYFEKVMRTDKFRVILGERNGKLLETFCSSSLLISILKRVCSLKQLGYVSALFAFYFPTFHLCKAPSCRCYDVFL